MKDHQSARSAGTPIDRDSVADSWGRAAAYDAYADGLHTYALGGLRDHQAAAAAVYCAFIAADHHVAHLEDADVLRPWLYAITRHYCRMGGLPRLGLTPPVGRTRDRDGDPDGAMAGLERSLLLAELASLDWPDTDGMIGAHREVLELSVRHGLESRAVGLMLSRPAAESFELLSTAWRELERSLAATALLRTTREHCPDLAELCGGWSGRLTMHRREPLVEHVDGCSRCQYYLHKVVGTPQAPTILPHVAAPEPLREKVLGDLVDTSFETEAAKAAIAGRLTQFDRHGFPVTTLPAPRSASVLTPGSASVSGSASASSLARQNALAGQGLRDLPRSQGLRGAAASRWLKEGPSPRGVAGVEAAPSRVGGGTSAFGRVGDAVDTHLFGGGAADLRAARRPAGSEAGTSAVSSAPSAPGAARVRTATGSYAARLTVPPTATTASPKAPSTVRRRSKRSPLRAALTNSALLGGVAAAGGTAFVLFTPSSPSTRALLTHDPGGAPGGVTQTPDMPLPTSGALAGPALPVAGSSGKGGILDAARSSGSGTAVILQAVVVTTDPATAPTAPGLPFDPAPLPTSPVPTAASPTDTGVLNVRVDQRSNNPGEVTITLWNSGNAPVDWTATPDAPYLKLSQTSGTIAPGVQQAVQVTVDQGAVPQGPWQAHVRFDPSGMSVTLRGGTVPTPPPTTSPSTSPTTPSTTPSTTSPSTSPTPSRTPTPTPTSTSTPTASSTSPSSARPTTSPSAQPSSTAPTTSSASPSTPPSTPRSTPTPSGSPTSTPAPAPAPTTPGTPKPPPPTSRPTSHRK